LPGSTAFFPSPLAKRAEPRAPCKNSRRVPRREAMPMHYTIDPARRLVLCIAEGRYTDDDARAHQEKLRKDPAFDPTFDQIIDMTRTTEIALTPGCLSDLITTQPFKIGVRRAMIVANPVQYGTSRMIGGMAGARTTHFRIFSTQAEALAWFAEDRPART
jgi:hypothetical protein